MKTEQFTYLSADSYDEAQIVNMEQKICSTLRFHLQIVTPSHYAHRFLRASYISSHLYNPLTQSNPPPCSFWFENNQMRFMVEYILEIALLEYDTVYCEPSLVAASAVYLARATFDIRDKCEIRPKNEADDDDDSEAKEKSQWEEYGYYSNALTHYTGHTLEAIVETVRLLHDAQKRQRREKSLKAVYEKYSCEQFKRVALRIPVDDRKLFPFNRKFYDTSEESEGDVDEEENYYDSDEE